MKADRFTVQIDLGNDAMRTPRDVASELEAIARRIRDAAKRDPGERSRLDDNASGIIRDRNGNTVGAWRFD